VQVVSVQVFDTGESSWLLMTDSQVPGYLSRAVGMDDLLPALWESMTPTLFDIFQSDSSYTLVTHRSPREAKRKSKWKRQSGVAFSYPFVIDKR
jgi:hypothetical protein